MTTISKAVYLGNIDDEYCGFTVGKEYQIQYYDPEDKYIGLFADDDRYRNIKNGAFHKFELQEGDGSFATDTECAVTASRNDKKPELRYYINGYEVDKTEFGNVRYTVIELDEFGVKCDTIKFELKFE